MYFDSSDDEGERPNKKFKKERLESNSNMMYSLDSDLRDQMVKQINHCTLLLCDDIDLNAKNEIIKEITKVVHSLMCLPIVINDDQIESEKSITPIEQTSKNQPLIMNNRTNNNSVTEETKIQKSNRDSILEEVDAKISKVKAELLTMLNGRSEITKIIKVLDASKFLSENDKQTSEIFYVRNVPWSIVIQNRLSDGDKKNTLMVFVHCEYEPKTTDWKCKTRIGLKMLSNRCDVYEASSKFDFEFKRRHGVGTVFISHKDLFDDKMEYIVDDSFMVEVTMICDKPIGT